MAIVAFVVILACHTANAQTPTPTPTPSPSPSATPLEDFVPPTLTITIPAPGTRTDESQIIFTGSVSDDREVLRVQWRRQGEKWRRAILNFSTDSETGEAGVTRATWAFTTRLIPGRRTTTFFIRAQDESLNESDTIGRPITRR